MVEKNENISEISITMFSKNNCATIYIFRLGRAVCGRKRKKLRQTVQSDF